MRNARCAETAKHHFCLLEIGAVDRDVETGVHLDETGHVETFLEYYTIVRRLRFERFLAHRRDLLERLNSYPRVVGEILWESGQLVIAGLPTEADVDAAEESLKRGDSEFRDLLAPFSLI